MDFLTAGMQKFLEKFGLPTLMALVLLFVLIGIVQGSLKELQAQMNDHRGIMGSHLTDTASLDDKTGIIVENSNKQTDLLKIICRNTAKNESQVALCDK